MSVRRSLGVVGLGTDYGAYLLFRNDEERRVGRSPREALETTAMRAGPRMLSGALTAAGTFYVLTLGKTHPVRGSEGNLLERRLHRRPPLAPVALLSARAQRCRAPGRVA